MEKTRLTTAQRQFAVQNFDRTFDAVFPRGMRESLAQEGKDIFDQIFIDGKSMNDLWEEEYQRTSYSYSAEQMKLHFMEAALSSKRIQVLVPGSDGTMCWHLRRSAGRSAFGKLYRPPLPQDLSQI